MRNQRGDGKETTPFVDSMAVQRQNGERQRFGWQLIGSFASAKASAAQNFWVNGAAAVQRAALPAGLPTTRFGQARQPALSLFSFMAFSSSGLGLSITEYLSPKNPTPAVTVKAAAPWLAAERGGRAAQWGPPAPFQASCPCRGQRRGPWHPASHIPHPILYPVVVPQLRPCHTRLVAAPGPAGAVGARSVLRLRTLHLLGVGRDAGLCYSVIISQK